VTERTDTQNKRYVVIDKQTTQVVVDNLRTRDAARIAKRDLEYKHREANEFRNMPSRYFVETDIDHPSGAGIYLH
jgi:hypothetical protein